MFNFFVFRKEKKNILMELKKDNNSMVINSVPMGNYKLPVVFNKITPISS